MTRRRDGPTGRKRGPTISAERSVRIRGRLLRWYRRNARDLPWRRTRDPYAIWISEVMLQQTQSATVARYWSRFLSRFPDARTLAAATEDAVLGAWAGLGYYRRAKALLEAARVVVAVHGGTLPSRPEALRALPGVGRYTAGAIASIAFGRTEPVLDGNVRRVLSRLLAMKVAFPRQERLLWDCAEALVRGNSPGEFNQALMELGATVCSPRRPGCDRCPLAADCAGLASGNPESFPERRRRPAPTRVAVAVAVVRRGRRVLLVRHGEGTPLRGAWDLPAAEIPPEGDASTVLREALRTRWGLSVPGSMRETDPLPHSILSRRLTLRPAVCRAAAPLLAPPEKVRWIDPSDIETEPVSGATRKVLWSLATGRAPAAQNRSQGGTQPGSATAGGARSGSRGLRRR